MPSSRVTSSYRGLAKAAVQAILQLGCQGEMQLHSWELNLAKLPLAQNTTKPHGTEPLNMHFQRSEVVPVVQGKATRQERKVPEEQQEEGRRPVSG